MDNPFSEYIAFIIVVQGKMRENQLVSSEKFLKIMNLASRCEFVPFPANEIRSFESRRKTRNCEPSRCSFISASEVPSFCHLRETASGQRRYVPDMTGSS